MVQVHTVFDCKHEKEIDVSVEDDVELPDSARGLGKCPDCASSEARLVAVAGVAPQPGGKLILDSILMMPVEG